MQHPNFENSRLSFMKSIFQNILFSFKVNWILIHSPFYGPPVEAFHLHNHLDKINLWCELWRWGMSTESDYKRLPHVYSPKIIALKCSRFRAWNHPKWYMEDLFQISCRFIVFSKNPLFRLFKKGLVKNMVSFVVWRRIRTRRVDVHSATICYCVSFLLSGYNWHL